MNTLHTIGYGIIIIYLIIFLGTPASLIQNEEFSWQDFDGSYSLKNSLTNLEGKDSDGDLTLKCYAGNNQETNGNYELIFDNPSDYENFEFDIYSKSRSDASASSQITMQVLVDGVERQSYNVGSDFWKTSTEGNLPNNVYVEITPERLNLPSIMASYSYVKQLSFKFGVNCKSGFSGRSSSATLTLSNYNSVKKPGQVTSLDEDSSSTNFLSQIIDFIEKIMKYLGIK